MNGVSDITLAIACHKAGILPSLIFLRHELSNLDLIESRFQEYATATNFGSLLVACELETIIDQDFFSLLIKYRTTFVEILNSEKYNMPEIYAVSVASKAHGITVTPKLLGGYRSVKHIYDSVGAIDCVTIKGPNGAGQGVESIILEDEIVKIKAAYPNIVLIVSGGINTSADIKKMLDLGADCVSLGTIFCTSQESNISLTAKNKIINASYKDVTRLETGAKHSALVFSKVEEKNSNNTVGLYNGIRKGTAGHVYVGTGIDHIHKIEPVQDIVSRLIADL
jgi:NAD(P)H-dependent flavin oxidoreductase YrpB (nitropropane dioxygenase family)